tara:strand:- start:13531 stop:14301 length:771 start_codon:yes stop_codon:yes gene_type:complete
LNFKTSQEAWEGLNAFFLNKSEFIFNKGLGAFVSGQVVMYDVDVKIEEPKVSPDFDFGNTFGYRKQKWSGLVNNYLDQESLGNFIGRVLEAENIKKQKNYNISMAFSNNHDHGKNCLLSLTAIRRNMYELPILNFTLRSSEITKRLLMDLLLIQRIGEEIYPNFTINMKVINMYQDPEAFCMFDSFKPIKSILEIECKKTHYQKKITRILRKFKTVDIKEIKYKVHKRCVRQLQRPNGIPLSGDRPMYAKELKLPK